jgi:hypothetical protein
MDQEFASTLVAWNNFFTAVAGIAATLVGLLFVALGLNPRIMTDVGPTGLRVWAGQTFHSFIVLLVLGLVGLIPDDGGETLAITMVILGVQGIVRIATDMIRVRGDESHEWGSWAALTRFVTPALAYLFLLWSARGVWFEDADSLYWLITIVFLLMIGALASCWELLKAVGNLNRPDSPVAPGA